MAEFSLQALHDEIEADPLGIGYKNGDGSWKEDRVIVDLINDPANGDVVQRNHISPEEVIEQIVIDEWDAITASQRLYIGLLPSLAEIDATENGTEVRANLLSIFGPTTTTRANLVSVVQKDGSRAEVLWGEAFAVSISNVAYAANL